VKIWDVQGQPSWHNAAGIQATERVMDDKLWKVLKNDGERHPRLRTGRMKVVAVDGKQISFL
jgi:hypothetical protein